MRRFAFERRKGRGFALVEKLDRGVDKVLIDDLTVPEASALVLQGSKAVIGWGEETAASVRRLLG